MVWNLRVMYKYVIGGATKKHIATEMGLVTPGIDGGPASVNNAPITLRGSNSCGFYKISIWLVQINEYER